MTRLINPYPSVQSFKKFATTLSTTPLTTRDTGVSFQVHVQPNGFIVTCMPVGDTLMISDATINEFLNDLDRVKKVPSVAWPFLASIADRSLKETYGDAYTGDHQASNQLIVQRYDRIFAAIIVTNITAIYQILGMETLTTALTAALGFFVVSLGILAIYFLVLMRAQRHSVLDLRDFLLNPFIVYIGMGFTFTGFFLFLANRNPIIAPLLLVGAGLGLWLANRDSVVLSLIEDIQENKDRKKTSAIPASIQRRPRRRAKRQQLTQHVTPTTTLQRNGHSSEELPDTKQS